MNVRDAADEVADAVVRRLARALNEGLHPDPHAGKCPNCGKGPFIDYCFACNFVPFWERKEGGRMRSDQIQRARKTNLLEQGRRVERALWQENDRNHRIFQRQTFASVP